MKAAAITIVVLSLADAILTLEHMARGVAFEANPLMADLILVGAWLFILVKVGTTVGAALFLYVARKYPLARNMTLVALGAYALLMVWHVRFLLCW